MNKENKPERDKKISIPIMGNEPIYLDDIVGQESAKEELCKVKMMLQAPTMCYVYGITIPNILLHGEPGTGKTLSVKALAHELQITSPFIQFYSINLQDIGTCYINETANYFAQTIKAIESNILNKETPLKYGVVFFDEFDSMAKSRSGKVHKSSEDDKLVNAINTYLDGDRKSNCITYVAATNYYDNVDNAIKSRFGKHIEYKMFTNEDEIAELFKIHIERANRKARFDGEFNIFKPIQYSLLAKYLRGEKINGRDISHIVDRAVEHKLFCLLDPEKIDLIESDFEKLKIEHSDFKYVIEKYLDEHKSKEKVIGFSNVY